MLLRLKFIPENCSGVTDLIALGFNPWIKKNAPITSFASRKGTICKPFSPKPGSGWIGVRSRKLGSVTA